MGLDIYFSNDKRRLISSIDSINDIQKELSIFQQKTGITIDEYGTTNLYINHIELLNDLIKKQNDWSKVFQKAIDINVGLTIEGD